MTPTLAPAGSRPRQDADPRTTIESLRHSIDEAIAREAWPAAAARLRDLFAGSPGLATAAFVRDRMRRIPALAPRRECRLAFARSFTVEPVVPLLEAAALLHGVELEVHVGRFGAYAQDLLDRRSELHRFSPDVVVLAVQTRDLLPELWERYPQLGEAEAERSVRRALDDLRGWLDAFRAASGANLVIQNLELPTPDLGILDSQGGAGQSRVLQRFNAELAELPGARPGVYVLDYDALVSRHGRLRWTDERKWLTARMPVSADCLWPLANEYLRFLLPLSGRVAKALVVDLDNTVWGGVLGEDGPEGLCLDAEYPGAAYLAVQRAILALHARGVIVAVASKNDHDEAMAVLERHPAMLLRPHHVAASRINWNDKAQSLREIAKELNIGLDALAFLDDSPAERERVRAELPEVTVIDVPADPMGLAPALRECPLLERLVVSAEDRSRGRLYAERRQRAEAERSAASLEDYYRSLAMEMDMREVEAGGVARAAQLTQKTNQFNLTTRRYTEAEIAAMAGQASVRCYQAAVRDRFGDSGVVGIAITRDEGDTCEIDTLLLSCRVIGRTIESAMIARLADEARRRGRARLRGWFLPTRRNTPAADFYPRHGFAPAAGRGVATLWECELATARLECPEWIRFIAVEGGTT